MATYTANGVLKPNTGAAPGTVGYVQNNYFVSSGSNVSPNTKSSVKGDHIFNEKHRISGYYGYNREQLEPGSGGPPTLPGLYSNYNDTRQAQRRVPLQLGLDVESHQAQPLLRGR